MATDRGVPLRKPLRKLAPPALAALSGALYGFACASDASPALAWIALAPLFLACVRVGPRAGAVCGLAFACVATVVLASWFPAMLRGFFGLSPAASWLGWLGLALGMNAPPYALLCGWLGWRTRTAAVAPVVVGAAWLAAEWLRAHGPVPNPYALLATSQLGTPWAQSADAVGAFGVGALVATGNAVLAGIFEPRLRGRCGLAGLALAAGVVVAAFAYGLWRGSLDHAPGAPVRVALVQPASLPGRPDEAGAGSLDRLLALTEAARAGAPGVVFWPESAVDFYLREPGPARGRVLALSRGLEADLVLGGPHWRFARPRPDYFASVFLVRGGRVAARYDKSRLVPFAEYAPLGAPFGASAGYRSGTGARLLATRDTPVGAFLCGEVLFPDVARRLARAGAGILANPSNDAWFGAEEPARHQLRAAAFRAIENRRPLVRPTTSGYSAVIDAHGRVVVQGERDVPALLEATVHPATGSTPYQRFGFAAAPCVAVGALATSLRRPSRPPSGGTRS